MSESKEGARLSSRAILISGSEAKAVQLKRSASGDWFCAETMRKLLGLRSDAYLDGCPIANMDDDDDTRELAGLGFVGADQASGVPSELANSIYPTCNSTVLLVNKAGDVTEEQWRALTLRSARSS